MKARTTYQLNVLALLIVAAEILQSQLLKLPEIKNLLTTTEN